MAGLCLVDLGLSPLLCLFHLHYLISPRGLDWIDQKLSDGFNEQDIK